jgi:serine/threonine-protein kinase
MGSCPSCSRPVAASADRCRHCGAALEPPGDVTLPGSPARVSTPRGASASPSAASAAFSTPGVHPSLDRGRFVSGTILGGRFRIVGVLGRGGMGEVYRAEDLRLGQLVALKFLPEALTDDPGRLQRFTDEVRLALRVTHPNVCRVHDIGEMDGLRFVSMEYVDGGDLASLLRRAGHLPEERAVEVARQLCAGLAAVHDQGIVHRDLKPANVLLDERGRVKLTDFGLASIQDLEPSSHAGTPAYMAPEQWDGRATVQSDLYALGLVLYEMFTGRPVFAGSTPAEFARLHRESAPRSLTTLVETLDPAVERVVLRCLEKDPVDRPASALAVAAALPGGDPLAAALAAGETPSPDLVARAQVEGELQPRAATGLVAGIVIGIAALVAVGARTDLVRLVPLEKPPAVLADRARDILQQLDYGVGADRTSEFALRQDYVRHLQRELPKHERADALRQPQPAGLAFWYRTSPQPLQRTHEGSLGGWMQDPPLVVPGMTRVELDPLGRLLGLTVVPAPYESTTVAAPPDWSVLFDAAGLDPTRFRSVDPQWTPPVFADARAAWEGAYPNAAATPLRVEAAAHRGHPVWFQVVEPWTRPAGTTDPARGTGQRVVRGTSDAVFFLILIAAGVAAWRNMRLGRGDRKGALRFAVYLGVVRFLWLLGAHHLPPGQELDLVMSHIAWSSFRVCLIWVFYLALEPYARRLWPHMMISWVRLVGGRWRDPLVGRHVLVGIGFGVACALVIRLVEWLSAGIQVPSPTHDLWSYESLRGLRHAVVSVLGLHTTNVVYAFYPIVLVLVLRLLLRRTWLAVAIASAFAVLAFAPPEGNRFVSVSLIAGFLGLFWFALFRFGFLTAMVSGTATAILATLPLTWQVSAWYFEITALVVGLTAVCVVQALRAALPRPATRPVARVAA